MEGVDGGTMGGGSSPLRKDGSWKSTEEGGEVGVVHGGKSTGRVGY